MTPSAEIESRPHWWKASALTTRPTLPLHAQCMRTYYSLRCYEICSCVKACHRGTPPLLRGPFTNLRMHKHSGIFQCSLSTTTLGQIEWMWGWLIISRWESTLSRWAARGSITGRRRRWRGLPSTPPFGGNWNSISQPTQSSSSTSLLMCWEDGAEK